MNVDWKVVWAIVIAFVLLALVGAVARRAATKKQAE